MTSRQLRVLPVWAAIAGGVLFGAVLDRRPAPKGQDAFVGAASPAAWPSLPGAQRYVGASLIATKPTPRGTLRVEGLEGSLELFVERDYAGVRGLHPEQADYAGVLGDQPFAEFYGLPVGAWKLCLRSPEGQTALHEVQITENGTSVWDSPVLEPATDRVLELTWENELLQDHATVRLEGPGFDHLRRWRGAPLELPGPFGQVERVSVRLLQPVGSDQVRYGGVFSQLAGETERLALELKGGEAELEARASAGPQASARALGTGWQPGFGLDVLAGRPGAGAPLSVALARAPEESGVARVVGLADGPHRVGLGRTGLFEYSVWTEVQVGAGTHPVELGPLEREEAAPTRCSSLLAAPLDPDDPIARRLAQRLGAWPGSLARLGPFARWQLGGNGWTWGVGSVEFDGAVRQPRGKLGPLGDERRAAVEEAWATSGTPDAVLMVGSEAPGAWPFGVATREGQTALLPGSSWRLIDERTGELLERGEGLPAVEPMELELDWSRLSAFAGLAPEAFGISSLQVTAYPRGNYAVVTPAAGAALDVGDATWVELRGEAGELLFWSWFEPDDSVLSIPLDRSPERVPLFVETSANPSESELERFCLAGARIRVEWTGRTARSLRIELAEGQDWMFQVVLGDRRIESSAVHLRPRAGETLVIRDV